MTGKRRGNPGNPSIDTARANAIADKLAKFIDDLMTEEAIEDDDERVLDYAGALATGTIKAFTNSFHDPLYGLEVCSNMVASLLTQEAEELRRPKKKGVSLVPGTYK